MAISIPIFTSQLEKSREAVDLANIRSAYAECSAAAIAGETQATAGTFGQIFVDNSSNSYYEYVPATQKEKGWKTPGTIKIGTFDITSVTHIKGDKYTVRVYADGRFEL